MASPTDRASAPPLAFDLAARLAAIDQKKLRGYRLERLRQELRKRDYGACLLSDPINIRYATGSRNMMLWTMHSPSRWAFVPAEGPVVLFEYDSSKHVNEGLETIAEIRLCTPWIYFLAGPRCEEKAGLWAREIADLVARHFPASDPTDVLEAFGVLELGGRQVGGLSGGQRRRLAVALAFLGRPRLVVLDEPTAGLDAEGRRAVWQAIDVARGRDAAVLLATHDLDEAEAVASRVVALSGGRIACDGTVADVKARAGRGRVSFRAPSRPLPAWVEAEPGGNGRVVVQTGEPGTLVERLVRANIPLRDLEVRPLDLEESLAALIEARA